MPAHRTACGLCAAALFAARLALAAEPAKPESRLEPLRGGGVRIIGLRPSAAPGDVRITATAQKPVETAHQQLSVVRLEDVSSLDEPVRGRRTSTSRVPFNLDARALFLAEADTVRFTATSLANTTYNWGTLPTEPPQGVFNPNNQQQNFSDFTPAQRDYEPPIQASVLTLGFNSGPVTTTQVAGIVERNVIRMLMGEASDRRFSEAERIGLIWVARNRINDRRFSGYGSLNGVLTARTPGGGYEFALWLRDKKQDKQDASRADCKDDWTRWEYDRITDVAGRVLAGQVPDNTESSFAFYTPTAADIRRIEQALNTNSTADARDIGLGRPPVLSRRSVPSVQIVLIRGLRPLDSSPPPFIFFREKRRDDPTVLDLRGGS